MGPSTVTLELGPIPNGASTKLSQLGVWPSAATLVTRTHSS
jgi:hypothetical protein